MAADGDAGAILDAAISCHTARDLDRAALLYRQVLDREPDNAEALNCLGALLQDVGQVADGLALIARAVEIDPDYPDAFANRARGLLALGQAEQAVVAAHRASQLDPSLAEAWLQLGLARFALGQYPKALMALREAEARDPDAVDTRVGIATVEQKLGHYDAAARTWRSVLAAWPDRVDALTQLGAVLGHLGQVEEAVTLHRRAVGMAPEDLDVLAAMAASLHLSREAEELVRVCRAILDRDPGRVGIRLLLAGGLRWLGQFTDAVAICRDILAERPADAGARQLLASMHPGMLNDDELAWFRARVDDPDLPTAEAIGVGFVVARSLDRRGDHDGAFRAFQAANALRATQDHLSGRQFDAMALHAYVERTCCDFTPALFAGLRAFGSPSELPVFIVGMPRSGTTLVEQIAASHPRVHGAGERKDISAIVQRLDAGNVATTPEQWDPDRMRGETDAHLDRLRGLGGGADRVIDKMPDNVLFVGQIRVLFPHARIILCRRDPRDVCISCFTTNFGDDLRWASSLEDCARRAVEIERLMDHWRASLPGPLLEIRYEALVSDQERESRRLIAFLGLDWDPACLAFHRTERPVRTASFWQVRQPIYAGSVGRWRRYEPHLGPMLKILADAGR